MSVFPTDRSDMDEENTTSRPDSSRRRLKVAGIATVALLAVPGGAVISNAFAADGGSPSTTNQGLFWTEPGDEALCCLFSSIDSSPRTIRFRIGCAEIEDRYVSYR